MPKGLDLNDTIAAISTPIGEGGIGIVRLSGQEALKIADKIFVSRKKTEPSKFKSFTTHYGHIKNMHGKVIDEVILTVMRAPKTYTKEDTVEINCHSGIVPLKKTVDLVIKLGARMAEPGEFTKRAFLNGRIDLTQAEAVLDIIKAKTEASLNVALSQLKGNLCQKIRQINDSIIELLTHIEASVDFSQEDITIIKKSELCKKANKIADELKKILDTSSRGIILREGILMVICGRRNVGKSTLLNTLLKEDRAIVSPQPGTTRDTIEERLDIDGIPIRVVDTAGIAATDDLVEKEGVSRSYSYIDKADLILLVLDNNRSFSIEDREIIKKIKNKPAIALVNKIDLKRKINLEKVKKVISGMKTIYISATEEKGIGELERTIAAMIWQGKINSSDLTLVTNIRHMDSIRKALDGIKRAVSSANQGLSEEFIALDIREAGNALGEIVGEVVTEDLLNKIFSEFCIGK